MQLRERLEPRSRLLGGVVVVVIHVLMWQALNYQFHHEKNAAIQPIQVNLVANDTPYKPVRLPELRADALPASQVFIPAPQVNVQESRAITVSTSEPLIGESTSAINSNSTTAPEPQTQLVSESEVDYLKVPEIRFPVASKRAKEQGTAILSVVFDTRGLVDRISVFKTSGYFRLDEAALRAVRSVQVKPYIRNGVAMPIEIRVPVEFSLRSAVTAS